MFTVFRLVSRVFFEEQSDQGLYEITRIDQDIIVKHKYLQVTVCRQEG